MTVDTINTGFALIGSIFILKCIIMTYRNKGAVGVSILSNLLFTGWAIFNIDFYFNLHQWFSIAGGGLLAITQVFWTGLILYYRYKNKKGIK